MADSKAPTRRQTSGDSRVRSGCRTCREQRPICDHCRRLGLVCRYELKLTWQAAHGCEVQHQSFSKRRSQTSNFDEDTEEWMFLNSHVHDFQHVPHRININIPMHRTSTNSARKLLGDGSTGLSLSPSHFGLSSLGLSQDEAYLLHYFDNFIAPRCVVSCDQNPYRHIILRIASSSPDGPVLQGILAVSAQQMQALGHAKGTFRIWDHRNRALELLRGYLFAYAEVEGNTLTRSMLAQEIMASTMMICFFEILHDCSDSWKVHASFGKSFLRHELASSHTVSSDCKELYGFAAAYFTYHDALASTAGTNLEMQDHNSSLCHFLVGEEPVLESLSGCSKLQIALLSEISDLASEASSPENILERTNSWGRKRNAIERKLYLMKDASVPTSSELPSRSVKEETPWLVSELKRLTCLLYFYARVDGSNPSDPHIMRLTEKILELLPHISLQTNTVLWPLFIVATLGVRPGSDGDRKLILERLHLLQQTRQLGNVRKARQIIENVWNARDIGSCGGDQGWAVLEGRHDAMSLA
ncbi:Zn(II)2Cys6 transcription factor [Colletotrichum scovillei]|nr:Zn(II)2Cys6 transcription factor [Colletotrichum scovillei]